MRFESIRDELIVTPTGVWIDDGHAHERKINDARWSAENDGNLYDYSPVQATKVVVGIGANRAFNGDSSPCKIVRVSPSGKVITLVRLAHGEPRDPGQGGYVDAPGILDEPLQGSEFKAHWSPKNGRYQDGFGVYIGEPVFCRNPHV